MVYRGNEIGTQVGKYRALFPRLVPQAWLTGFGLPGLVRRCWPFGDAGRLPGLGVGRRLESLYIIHMA